MTGRKRGVVAAVVPSVPVSGVFLGGGRSVGPSTSSTAKLSVDDERLMAALLSDLDRHPTRDGDEDEEGEGEDDPARAGSGAALGDVALFAQPDAFSDALQAVYEADGALMQRTATAGRRAQRTLRKATSGSRGAFDVRPPQPIMDLDDLLDQATAAYTPHTAATTTTHQHDADIDNALSYSPPSSPHRDASGDGGAEGEGAAPMDAQHLSNLAALAAPAPPHKKKRREGGGFAFSSSRAIDSNASALPLASSRPSALPPSAPVPSSLPSASDVFSSVLSSSSSSSSNPSTASASAVPSSAAARAGLAGPSVAIASSLAKDCGLSPVGADSSLLLYYYDAYEDPVHTPGTVYLFGKALIPSLSASASTCLQVTGIQRNVFLLPRQFALLNADDESSVTDRRVERLDVFNELRDVLKEFGVESFKVKPVRRSYCFDRELPVDSASGASLLDPVDGVPSSAEYMKLVYPFTCRALPRSLKGRTFSRVFGTKSTALELLLLKRKLMGPAWLEVRELVKVDKVLSWCRFEYQVNDSKAISHCPADRCPADAPLFSLVSLSAKSVRNERGKAELVMVSLLHQPSVNIDTGGSGGGGAGGQGSADFGVSVETAVVPLPGQQLPTDWPLVLKTHNAKRANRLLVQCSNERALLGWLLTRLGNLDPDVLLSHDLHQGGIDLLCSRLHALKVPHWSKLNRLKRTQIPIASSSSSGEGGHFGGGSSLLDRGVGSGRLMVDTELMTKEFLAGQRLYSLGYLAEHLLSLPREDIDWQAVPSHYTRSSDLLRLTAHTEADCFIALRLAVHTQLLPLTKQLTALAGNTWSRTLRSMRSERVEWLLLHHFHALKFIVPEKYTAAEKREREARLTQQRIQAEGGGEGGGDNNDEDNEGEVDDDGDVQIIAGKGTQTRAQGGKGGSAAKKKRAGSGKGGAAAAKAKGAGSTSASRSRRGKPLYSGGLVLEPKRGFYEQFVLVLDFNSLYPSIIQEFNLCFTTLPHWRAPSNADAAAPHGAVVEQSQADAMDGEGAGEDAVVVAASSSALLPLPSADAPHGQLPAVLARLVARRREVKKLEKAASDPAVKASLHIRQMALKLVANSMYGCLGFTNSRFYAPSLAALITSQGRDILSSSVELCASLGANVIYGDTDSLMIDTATRSYDAAITLGQQLKREINKRHAVLEIDIDGVYRNMLLLRKKKYAALAIKDDGKGGRTEVREIKGLDAVRRDWCLLSKETGLMVLNFLLSGKAREEVIESIVLALHEVRSRLHHNTVHLDQFVITKKLTKHPHDYADGHAQPHVQVALQLIAKGEKIKADDVISYVVCTGEGVLAKRCYHPSTVIAASGALTVDVAWYLANQVHPPIVRLCGVMEELDSARIAHALGLDPRHYKQPTEQRQGGGGGEDEEEELIQLSSLYSDPEQRFRDCKPLSVHCPHCKQKVTFRGAIIIAEEEERKGDTDQPASTPSAPGVSSDPASSALWSSTSPSTTSSLPRPSAPSPAPPSSSPPPSSSSARPFASHGFSCPTPGCVGLLTDADDPSTLLAALHSAVLLSYRSAMQSYYTSNWQCNDSGCRHTTRDMSAHPRPRCLRPRCQGRPLLVSPAKSLYLHLLHLLHLFDTNAHLERVVREEKRRSDIREAQMAATNHSRPNEAGGGATSSASASAAAPPAPTSWMPPVPSVMPSELLSARQMELLRAMHERVTRLLSASHYHHIQPSTFHTSVGERRGR